MKRLVTLLLGSILITSCGKEEIKEITEIREMKATTFFSEFCYELIYDNQSVDCFPYTYPNGYSLETHEVIATIQDVDSNWVALGDYFYWYSDNDIEKLTVYGSYRENDLNICLSREDMSGIIVECTTLRITFIPKSNG